MPFRLILRLPWHLILVDMLQIHQFLLRFKPYRWLILVLRHIKIGKTTKVPLYDILAFFIQEIQNQDLTTKASAITFNFFLALFPATLFLFTLIPYFPIVDLDKQILEFFSEIMPESAFDAINTTIYDIVSKQRGGLLSFGFLMALYFATNGISSLMSSFNKTNAIFENRSFIKQRLLAIGLTFLEVGVLIMAVILILGGKLAVDILVLFEVVRADYVANLLLISEWIIIIFLIYTGISVLYFFGPAVRKRWKFFSVGSWVATLLFILASLGFSYYVDHFGNYNKLYGSIGTLIVIMLWMNINSIILLIGFELNAAIYINRSRLEKARQELDKYEEAE